jgi:hypothetical protein
MAISWNNEGRGAVKVRSGREEGAINGKFAVQGSRS